jgi:hypothetical protein
MRGVMIIFVYNKKKDLACGSEWTMDAPVTRIIGTWIF